MTVLWYVAGCLTTFVLGNITTFMFPSSGTPPDPVAPLQNQLLPPTQLTASKSINVTCSIKMIEKSYYSILALIVVMIFSMFITIYRSDSVEILIQILVSLLALLLIIIEPKPEDTDLKRRRYLHLFMFLLISIQPALYAFEEILLQQNTRPEGIFRNIGESLVPLSIALTFLAPVLLMAMAATMTKTDSSSKTIIKYAPVSLAVMVAGYNVFYMLLSG